MQSKSAFIFKEHSWNPKKAQATFSYQIIQSDHVFDFVEKLWFPLARPVAEIPPMLLKNTLDSLLLVLGISYYKLFCPKELVLSNVVLSKKQADFWNTLYTKGLGELFYKNKIDFRGLISFPFSENNNQVSVKFSRKDRLLLGIGGGKDSIVAGEILKKMGKSFSAFVVNNHSIQAQTMQLLGIDGLMINREIDPLLLDLNKRSDIYNGHVPVSSQTAFIALFSALLFDYKYIVMANEQSANYGSVKYLGQDINHQWSKSYEFEQLFQNYVKSYITTDVYYFSLLRPFNEIAIVEMFSQYKKYLNEFSSCNRNFRIKEKAQKKWCGKCPKCAFTFAMLSAFLPKKELLNIFGQNLFAREDLIQVYKELLGVINLKPFDCVGTPDEVKVAFYLALQKGEYDGDPVMELFQKDVLPKISDVELLKEQVFFKSEKHSIPKSFQEAQNI